MRLRRRLGDLLTNLSEGKKGPSIETKMWKMSLILIEFGWNPRHPCLFINVNYELNLEIVMFLGLTVASNIIKKKSYVVHHFRFFFN